MSACKICKAPVTRMFSKRILKKYDAEFYRCGSCGFVQTSEPAWLAEAYGSAITSLDIGLPGRNVWLSGEVSRIIDLCFPRAGKMLDFAGGYGLLVRLMRDKGYDFYRQDDFCENLFARYFDLADAGTAHFDVVTAFEVFEHFVSPCEEIRRVLSHGENLIFSTELLPESEVENWWYLSPETGQHIAFYTVRSLAIVAEENKLHFYSNGRNLHIYSKEALPAGQVQMALNPARPRRNLLERIAARILRSKPAGVQRSSLLESDYKKIQEILKRS